MLPMSDLAYPHTITAMPQAYTASDLAGWIASDAGRDATIAARVQLSRNRNPERIESREDALRSFRYFYVETPTDPGVGVDDTIVQLKSRTDPAVLITLCVIAPAAPTRWDENGDPVAFI